MLAITHKAITQWPSVKQPVKSHKATIRWPLVRRLAKPHKVEFAVAIGDNAGNNAQGTDAVAIGASAGLTTQGNGAVAFGQGAGETSQGANAVALGKAAGQVNQGINSISIGQSAGLTNQANNSIILNATGSALDQTTANTFTVAPVRNDVANIGEVVFYNTTSKEITYGNVISVAGNITGGNIVTSGSGGNITLTGGNITGANVVTANSFVGNGATLSNVATQVTGSWTVPVGNNTQSFTVPINNTYQLWVLGNIPNGIIVYNATVSVSNTNVPVIGQQFAWNYEGGGNILMFTSIPAQIVGTAGDYQQCSTCCDQYQCVYFWHQQHQRQYCDCELRLHQDKLNNGHNNWTWNHRWSWRSNYSNFFNSH
jgi:hypothetical protein